jgi:diguanylate cyclase (GGDEF)-like protein
MKFFLWITVLVFLATCSNAKELSLDQIKVAYTYNFLKHTSWKEESEINEYTIAIVSDNENLKNMFLMLSSRKLLKDKRIKILFYNDNISGDEIQALYIDNQDTSIYENLFYKYKKSNVLIISDGYEDKKKVMINLFQSGEKVTFEINKANILNRSLKISPDLILLGGTEIDVAKLYKNSQDALKEQKETIESLNKNIKDKNIELDEKIASIKEQKLNIQNQKLNIQKYQKDILIQLKDIEDQEKKLVKQNIELRSIYKNIETQRKKLLTEEENVKEKGNALKLLEVIQKEKEKELDSTKKELEHLNDKINTQEQKLLEKESTITTQKDVIGYFLFFFIVITILGLYVIRQNRLLKELSQTDALTGLFNRRAIINSLNREISKFKRYEAPFSILLIDIDYFKSINDTYGHDKGDEVLKMISLIMKENTRESDVCSRWGGEEFMILVSNTDLNRSVKIAQHLKDMIENTDFSINDKVTVSIGISTFTKDQDEESLVKKADEALYKAKNNGRNMVVY